MKITPQDINNHEFKRSIRGYDMDEVDAFLTQVAAELELLVAEKQELKDGAKAGDVDLTEYRKKNELLQKTLLAAQDVTEKIKNTSQMEVEQVARAAKQEADKIINRAHEDAALVKAQIDDLKRQRDAFVIQFKALLDTYYKFLSELKKSDFEALSAVKADAANVITSIPKTSVSVPEAPKAKSALADVPEVNETSLNTDEQPAALSSDPIESLQKLDFDDLIREDTGEGTADDDPGGEPDGIG